MNPPNGDCNLLGQPCPVPPGQISQNTLNFLKNLQIPERNDRDWFKSHEPSFRQAEKASLWIFKTVDLSLQNRTAGMEGFCRRNATTIE